MTTATIDPTGADLKRIASTVGADTPVTMLNLLRFREQARYPDDTEPCSGRDAYARYSKLALAHVRAVGGEPVLMADVLGRFIGPDGEDWDEMDRKAEQADRKKRQRDGRRDDRYRKKRRR